MEKEAAVNYFSHDGVLGVHKGVIKVSKLPQGHDEHSHHRLSRIDKGTSLDPLEHYEHGWKRTNHKATG